MDILSKAIIFATNVHGGMKRKGSDAPYILHPLEAASVVASMTSDSEIIAAAVLHDVVEDAGVTLEELEVNFGKRIAELVASETEDKRENLPPDATWMIRKQESIELLKNTDDIGVKMVFLGDKLANMRSFYRDHQKMGEALWLRFNQKDPKKHAWYYRTIAECVSELKDHPVWKEYDRLIYEVFEKDGALNG